MSELPYKYIYHCHTTRCGHATGEDEEIVLAAIAQGVKVLCFTDHSPIPYVDQPTIRMEMNEVDEYVDSISKLKDKYKDQIEIHIAFEAEYFPNKCDYLLKLLKHKGIEYFIVGEHMIDVDDNLIWTFDYEEFGKSRCIQTYTDSIVDALDKGLTKYVAHPDLFIYGVQSFDDEVKDCSRRIVEAAIRNNAVIEFNIHGMYTLKLKEFGYPNIHFWKMVKEEYPEAKIVIGLDVHSLREITDNPMLEKAYEIINEIGLNVSHL